MKRWGHVGVVAATLHNSEARLHRREKGLAVIEAFDQERSRLSMTEVAQRTGLTRAAAARRYLLTLTQLGYVHYDGRMFSLTAKVLRLGQSYLHSGRLPRVVHPQLHKLAHVLQEASSAGVLDGNDVLCIAATTAGRIVSATLAPGTRVPAYCTSNGRVLLAALPQEQVDQWLEQQQIEPLTPHTITHRGAPAHRDRPRTGAGLRHGRSGTRARPAHAGGADPQSARRHSGGAQRELRTQRACR